MNANAGSTSASSATTLAASEAATKPSSDRRFGLIVFLITLFVGVVAAGTVLVLQLKMRTQKAKAVMKGVEIAVKGYHTEYLRLPFAVAAPYPVADSATFESLGTEGLDFIKILDATDRARNPRVIRFVELPKPTFFHGGFTPSAGLADPWGRTGYKVVLDYSGDGLIDDPEIPSSTIKASVILWSAGADGDFTTWHDNVRSWK